MSQFEHHWPTLREATVSRRAVLCATAGATAVGLAGCSGVTSQSFEVEPVGLPSGARETLDLGLDFSDSSTTTREFSAAEVTVTTHVSGFKRVVE
jgi:hypothetical protein